MLETRFTRLTGCSVPIQQAGMGAIATPELAAAVADAGGLGMVSGGGLPVPAIESLLDELRSRTAGRLGVNFLMPFLGRSWDRSHVRVAAAKADVVEFFYGEPDREIIDLVHSGGALACWQIGSQTEASAAGAAGCDFLIAQGIEAGGHVRGHTGLLALLDEVLEAVDIPVLAAGGIGTGRTLAAALAAGAGGARVGTRFVAAQEAGAHPTYVEALIAAQAEDTVYTEVFSIGWPNAPHRVLRSCIAAVEAFSGDIVGEAIGRDGRTGVVHRFGLPAPHRSTTGEIGAMPLHAGESVGGVRSVQPAAEIIRELVEDADRRLRRWG